MEYIKTKYTFVALALAGFYKYFNIVGFKNFCKNSPVFFQISKDLMSEVFKVKSKSCAKIESCV